MMKRLAILTILLAIPGWLVGCGGESQPQPGRVAVLDIVQVSNAIGRGKVMQAAMNAAQKEAGAKLQAMQEDFARRLNAERAKTATVEDMKRIERLDAELQSRYQQEIASARSRIASLNATLVAQLRSDVRPIAQRIAEERGLSIVLESGEGVVYVADECEITGEVIAAMRSAAGETPPSMPGLPRSSATSRPTTGPATQP
jgi:Skp family chaperone for outer membrane proteins